MKRTATASGIGRNAALSEENMKDQIEQTELNNREDL